MSKIIAILLLSFSCAAVNLIRPIADRRYTIDRKTGVFIWQTCTDRTFFKKRCKKWFQETLDIRKEKDRELIYNLGFVLGKRK